MYLSDDLSWAQLVSDYFQIPPQILTNIYRCSIKSILTGCLIVWYGSCAVSKRKALQRVVRAAEMIIGTKLPTLQDIFHTRCLKNASEIVFDICIYEK